MRAAIEETDRRREIQVAYNHEHGITPETIVKGISDIAEFLQSDAKVPKGRRRSERRRRPGKDMELHELERTIVELEEEMLAAAEDLRFEYAAKLRDEIRELRRDLDEAQLNEGARPSRYACAALLSSDADRETPLSQSSSTASPSRSATFPSADGGMSPRPWTLTWRRSRGRSRRSSGLRSHALESLASAASAQVQAIVEAAETSAADIERQAGLDATRARQDAEREAERTREDAIGPPARARQQGVGGQRDHAPARGRDGIRAGRPGREPAHRRQPPERRPVAAGGQHGGALQRRRLRRARRTRGAGALRRRARA